MTDKVDPPDEKKSIPNLHSIQGGVPRAADAPKPVQQEKRKFRDIHYNIAATMAGQKLGWPAFQAKLHRWVDHLGTSIPYEENSCGIVAKVSDDRIHYLIGQYWGNILSSGDRPVVLGRISADDMSKTRRLWLGLADGRKKPFLCLGWRSEPRPALHKVSFDPTFPDSGCPLFSELMGRMRNAETFMAWIGSLFDEESQRQQYAWLYGEGGNGKSSLVRVLMKVLGPVAAAENPPTRDAKHWTCGLSNKRLVVFPDCNNTAFVTSGEFKQLTGEDPVRMEPKGKPVYYENIEAKFLIVSNDRPLIKGLKADLRRVLFFSLAPLPDDAKVPNYEERLMAEAPHFLSLCWKAYRVTTGGNPRHEFVAEDQSEIEAVVDDTEHEMEAFVLGRLTVISYPVTTPKNARKSVQAQDMIDLMVKCGFKTEYERRKLRDYMARAHGIVRDKIKADGTVRLVYLNCLIAPA